MLVTSGKGGVGKSTVSFYTGLTLALRGRKVLIIELDTGLRSLDVIAGISEQTVYPLGDVTAGRVKPSEAIVSSPLCKNLQLLCAPFSPEDRIEPHRLAWLCQGLDRFYDYTFLDAPAGIGYGFKVGCTAARSALIVATPDPISARDGGVVCDLLAEAGITRRRLIINRVDAKAVARGPISDLDEVIDTVGARLLGVLPESTALHLAAVSGRALPEGEAATAFANIARRLEGEQVPLAVQ